MAHFVCRASNVTDLIKWEKDGKEVKDGKEGVAIVTCNSSSHLLVAVANNRRGRYSCTIASEVKQSFELGKVMKVRIAINEILANEQAVVRLPHATSCGMLKNRRISGTGTRNIQLFCL